jgi:hypothetical protein
MAVSGYGVPDTAAYDRASSDLTYRYNTDSAANAYGRFLSQSRGSRNLGDLTKQYQRGLPSAYASFNGRGLGGSNQSGLQQRSMRNYIGDYGTDYLRGQEDLTQGLQQYDMNQASNTANYNNQLLSLQEQKAREIANAALGIEALRPYLGGL